MSKEKLKLFIESVVAKELDAEAKIDTRLDEIPLDEIIKYVLVQLFDSFSGLDNSVVDGEKQCLYSTQTFLNKNCITYCCYGRYTKDWHYRHAKRRKNPDAHQNHREN